MFLENSQMIFLVGGKDLVTSPKGVYTSEQKVGQTKNVLLLQNKCFLFDQYGFSKILVAPSFEFAKTLFRKVAGFQIWRTEVKTSSHLEL